MPPTKTKEVAPTQDDEDQVPGTAPTFKIFSGTLKAFEKPDDTRKYLSCTASSSVEDLHGDRMTEECVQGMAPQAKTKGMTIFLNHSYKVPEDVFGKTVDARIVSRSSTSDSKPIYDLDLEIMLNEANSRAVETYAGIKDQGMKMGVSIGAMIEDYEFIDEEAGFWGGLEIKAVNLLEASIVGIPANQRSWVVNALNALGAPREIVRKALGKTYDDSEDPRPKAPVKAAEATETVINEVHEVTFKYLLDGVDVTDQIQVESTDTIITEDSDAPDEENPSDAEKGDDELDPADDEAKSLEAVAALADLKTSGADAGLLEIVLGFLEGATEEVASLRKANHDLIEERDRLTKDLEKSVEIVETIAATPLGRKAQFQGPVSTFRTRFGGYYSEGLLKLLEGEDEA